MARRRSDKPENIVTGQIRELLRIMRVPHTKIWQGPLSEPGTPDILGTLPGEHHMPGGINGPADAVELANNLSGGNHDLTGALMFLARELRFVLERGRPLYCEVKAGRGRLTEDQREFLLRHRRAGAVAFPAWGPKGLLRQLREAGFRPAERILDQFSGPEEAEREWE
jgi:hypothetical protein